MKRIASEVKVPEEYIRTSSRLNSVPVCAHIHLCICKCLQVWVYTCVCVHVHVYAYACLHTHKSICASVPLCICIYACVQAHAFMYVCMCAIQLFPWLWPFLSEEGRTHVCQFQSFVHTAARHGDLHPGARAFELLVPPCGLLRDGEKKSDCLPKPLPVHPQACKHPSLDNN